MSLIRDYSCKKSQALPALMAVAFAFVILIPNYVLSAPNDQDATAYFEIKQLVVEGNTLVSTEKLQASISKYIKPNASINTLEAALQAIERRYSDAGFGAIKAVLPEQEAEDGIFHIKVIEAKLGKVRVIGNTHYRNANIINSAPALMSGQSPNLKLVAESLRIANESFAKNTHAVIVKSSEPNQVDAELRVLDGRPWRFAVSLDNTGTEATGRERLSFIYQNANVFDLDHAFALQYTTSPNHEDDVKIFGISYRIPLYKLGDTIDLSVGHSDVSSGSVTTTAGIYGISGSGDFVAANYNYALPSWHDLAQRVIFGLNWHSFQSNVSLQGGGVSLIPDLTSAPAGITYSITQDEGDQRWLASAGWWHNLPSGSQGDTGAYNQFGARPGANSNFNLLRYNFSYSTPIFTNWNIQGNLNGQYTTDLLISGEQFGIGGVSSVRGFEERVLSGDKGVRGSVELGTPALPGFTWKNSRLTGAVFYDYGYISRNRPLTGELRDEEIGSAGLGLRATIAQSMQLRFDWARVLDGGATERSGDYRGHVQLVVIF